MQIELLNRKKWRTRLELANAIFDYTEIFHNRQRRSQGVSNVSRDVALSGNLVVRASLLWGCGARGESFVSGWHRPCPEAGEGLRSPARSKDRHVHHTSRARRSSMQALDLHNRKTG